MALRLAIVARDPAAIAACGIDKSVMAVVALVPMPGRARPPLVRHPARDCAMGLRLAIIARDPAAIAACGIDGSVMAMPMMAVRMMAMMSSVCVVAMRTLLCAALPHVHRRAGAALRQVLIPAIGARLPAATVALHVKAAFKVGLLVAITACLTAAATALGISRAIAEACCRPNVVRCSL